ncbi:MAG: hypothetical protein WBW78_13595 [Terrimicrobiaceae bacterium]
MRKRFGFRAYDLEIEQKRGNDNAVDQCNELEYLRSRLRLVGHGHGEVNSVSASCPNENLYFCDGR